MKVQVQEGKEGFLREIVDAPTENEWLTVGSTFRPMEVFQASVLRRVLEEDMVPQRRKGSDQRL
jgi:hypothetical protein